MSYEYDGPYPGDLPDDQPLMCDECGEEVDEDEATEDGLHPSCAEEVEAKRLAGEAAAS